jgi:hypothetical protein
MLEKIMEKRRQREDWGWGGGKSQISYRRPAVWAQLKATSPPSPLWRGLLPLVVAPPLPSSRPHHRSRSGHMYRETGFRARFGRRAKDTIVCHEKEIAGSEDMHEFCGK